MGVDPRTNIFEQDLTEEEAKTLQTYSQEYDPKKLDKVRQYCKAISEDKHLFWKVRQNKRSTFFAYANGGCDWPLCDQLVFASEYLKTKIPKSLKWERGSWSFEVGSGTFPKLQANGLFQAVRPRLCDSMDEGTLTKLRRVMEEYLLLHLDTLHVG